MNAPSAVLLTEVPLIAETLQQVLQAIGIGAVFATPDASSFVRQVNIRAPALAIAAPVWSELPQEIFDCAAIDASETRLVVISRQTPPSDLQTSAVVAWLPWESVSRAELQSVIRRVMAGERLQRIPERLEDLLERTSEHRELALLTLREREVLGWIGTGADNAKIAAHLEITERTVRAHVGALYQKLSCENRTELALLARRLQLVRPPPSGAGPSQLAESPARS